MAKIIVGSTSANRFTPFIKCGGAQADSAPVLARRGSPEAKF